MCVCVFFPISVESHMEGLVQAICPKFLFKSRVYESTFLVSDFLLSNYINQGDEAYS